MILVVERGGIRAPGNHQERLRLGGRYAGLYELQARAYR
jgi:ABC-type transport system involved in Fe-S cluster assembly fused permease/ATPase subunit